MVLTPLIVGKRLLGSESRLGRCSHESVDSQTIAARPILYRMSIFSIGLPEFEMTLLDDSTN